MGRSPCCDENGLKKGPWTPEEDQKLTDYIEKHGHGSWRALPKLAGTQRTHPFSVSLSGRDAVASFGPKCSSCVWFFCASHTGLNRCGKSCRLRWTNYLRPDIKRGKFTPEEEQTILQLHSVLGNKYGTPINKHLACTIFKNIYYMWCSC